MTRQEWLLRWILTNAPGEVDPEDPIAKEILGADSYEEALRIAIDAGLPVPSSDPRFEWPEGAGVSGFEWPEGAGVSGFEWPEGAGVPGFEWPEGAGVPRFEWPQRSRSRDLAPTSLDNLTLRLADVDLFPGEDDAKRLRQILDARDIDFLAVFGDHKDYLLQRLVDDIQSVEDIELSVEDLQAELINAGITREALREAETGEDIPNLIDRTVRVTDPNTGAVMEGRLIIGPNAEAALLVLKRDEQGRDLGLGQGQRRTVDWVELLQDPSGDGMIPSPDNHPGVEMLIVFGDEDDAGTVWTDALESTGIRMVAEMRERLGLEPVAEIEDVDTQVQRFAEDTLNEVVQEGILGTGESQHVAYDRNGRVIRTLGSDEVEGFKEQLETGSFVDTRGVAGEAGATIETERLPVVDPVTGKRIARIETVEPTLTIQKIQDYFKRLPYRGDELAALERLAASNGLINPSDIGAGLTQDLKVAIFMAASVSNDMGVGPQPGAFAYWEGERFVTSDIFEALEPAMNHMGLYGAAADAGPGYGVQVVRPMQPVKDWDAPRRTIPSPDLMSYQISDEFQRRTGRLPTRAELLDLVNFLTDQYRLSYDQVDALTEREYYEEMEAGIEAGEPWYLRADQKALLMQPFPEETVELDPVSAFKRHFAEKYAGAISIGDQSQRAGDLRDTLWGAVVASRSLEG